MKHIVRLTVLSLAIWFFASCAVAPVANPRILGLGAQFTGSRPSEADNTENNDEAWHVDLNEHGDLKLLSSSIRIDKSLLNADILNALEQAGIAPGDVTNVLPLGSKSLFSVNSGEFGGGVYIATPAQRGATVQRLCAGGSIGIFMIGDHLVNITSLRHGVNPTGGAYNVKLGVGDSESRSTCQKLFDLPTAPVVATSWRGALIFSDGSAIYAMDLTLRVEKLKTLSHQIAPTGMIVVGSSILISAPPVILELKEHHGRFSESWYHVRLK